MYRFCAAYLSDHAGKNEPFHSPLRRGTLPPYLEPEYPVRWGTHSASPSKVAIQRLVGCIQVFQLILTLADYEQLLVLGLKEANANGKIDGHDPKLGRAWKRAIQWIHQEDHEQVYVEDQNRRQGEVDLAHSNSWHMSIRPDKSTSCEYEYGVGDGKHNVGDAISIKVGLLPVVAFRIKIADHDTRKMLFASHW